MDLLWEMTSWLYNWDRKFWYNALAVWLDKYILRLDLNYWLYIKDLQLYRAVNPKYIRKIFDVKYEIKNNNNKTECEAKDKDVKRSEDTKLYV